MIGIDIIILSYAKTDKLKQITTNCVESLLSSENPDEIRFETLVIESNNDMRPYQYPGTKTIYVDKEFGYNKFMNIGINLTSNPYVCMCNNDLLFHTGWATQILKAFKTYPILASANPYCSNFNYDIRIINGENVIRRDKNLGLNGILTGWCIFAKREILDKIGALDEQFTFWFADNDYDLTLRKYNIKHALIKSSLVTHLECQSHHLLADRRDELTIGQKAIFEKKWRKQIKVNAVLNKIRSLIRLQ